MSEQLKRWALRLYNDCGGYSPEMVDPQTLPDPASRTAYVLEADAGAALAAKDARIAGLEGLLREISNWLVCEPIATPEDMAQSFTPFREQIDNVLASSAPKGDSHE